MTPAEFKEQLLKQYNDTADALKRIEGALAACDELMKTEEKEPAEESTDD